MSDELRVCAGTLRIVCAKRKRYLQKRGVFVRWSSELGAYVREWNP